MIKKALSISLALLYTVTVLGFAVNFHYCFNRVSGVTVNQPVKMCTSLKLATTPKCCKEKHIEVKVKDGHQSQVTVSLNKNFALQLPCSTVFSSLNRVISGTKNLGYNRGPPVDLSSQPDIYLSNHNFRV